MPGLAVSLLAILQTRATSSESFIRLPLCERVINVYNLTIDSVNGVLPVKSVSLITK